MKIPPALRRLLIAGRGWTETYVKPVALPMYGLRGLAAQLTGPSRRLKLRQLRSGMRRCAISGLLPSCSWFASHGFPVSKALPRSHRYWVASSALVSLFGILIGLYFTPGLALASRAGRSGEGSATRPRYWGIDPDADEYPLGWRFRIPQPACRKWRKCPSFAQPLLTPH